MFPHTITVFTKDENDEYQRVVIEGVYWYGSTSRTLSNKGMDDGASVKVVVPLRLFKGIERGSLIVKGLVSEIKSIAELNDYITVTSLDVNDVGSEIDHVIVQGS